jgi:hypothetical protein
VFRVDERIQIKGTARGKRIMSGQNMWLIKMDGSFDAALFLLLDNATLALWEIWEVSFKALIDRLAAPVSNAPALGTMHVPEFKRIGTRSLAIGALSISTRESEEISLDSGTMLLETCQNPGARAGGQGLRSHVLQPLGYFLLESRTALRQRIKRSPVL